MTRKNTKEVIVKTTKPKPKPKANKAKGIMVPYVKKQNGFGASINALGFRGGYDTSRGFYVEKANAFHVDSKKLRPIKSDVSLSPEAAARGVNPFVRAWGGSARNEFGAFSPNKDTIEPFDELITVINGTASFGVTSYDVNPGNPTTFPLLSQKAILYQRYNFAKCEFYLTPLVTVATAAGKFLMAADLEAREDSPPDSVRLMENNSIHADAMPYEPFGMEIAGVVRHQESWFVRDGLGYPGGTDPRVYDCATLFVGTYGNTVAPNMELRVRGIVELYDLIEDPPNTIPPSLHMMQMPFDYSSPVSMTSNVYISPVFAFSATEGVPSAPDQLARYSTYTGWIGSAGAVTCPRNGIYRVVGYAELYSTTGSITSCRGKILVDGVDSWLIQEASGASGTAGTTSVEVSGMIPLLKNQVLEVEFQSTFASGTTTIRKGYLMVYAV